MEATPYIRRITNRLSWIFGANVVLAVLLAVLTTGVVQLESAISRPEAAAVFLAYALISLGILYKIRTFDVTAWKFAFIWNFVFLWFAFWLLTFSGGVIEGALLSLFLLSIFMTCGVIGYIEDKKDEVYYRADRGKTINRIPMAIGAVVVAFIGIYYAATVFDARLLTLLELARSGTGLGAIYALIAVGFVLIFKITDVLNFAHGMLVVFAAYLVIVLSNLGIPPLLSVFLVVVVFSIALAVVLERLVFRHFIGEPVLSVIMATLALFYIFESIPRLMVGGTEFRSYPSEIVPDYAISVGPTQVAVVSTIAVLASIILVLALLAFFKYNVVGAALRAAASDEHGAVVLGIDITDTVKLGWALGIMLTVVGAVLLAMFRGGASYDFEYTLFLVFPAVVFGGLDSVKGALVGGIVIGLLQMIGGFYYAPIIGSGVAEVLPVVFLLTVIMIRPYGLWGTERIERI